MPTAPKTLPTTRNVAPGQRSRKDRHLFIFSSWQRQTKTAFFTQKLSRLPGTNQAAPSGRQVQVVPFAPYHDKTPKNRQPDAPAHFFSKFFRRLSTSRL